MSSDTMQGHVYQINRKGETANERGLPKLSVYRGKIKFHGLEGDFNRYRHESRRDNPNMALLIMPLEMIDQLNFDGWPVKPGDLGENITTVGIPYSEISHSNLFKIGDSVIQISGRCDPCKNLYTLSYVGEERGPEFLKILVNRRGWYARVLKEGEISVGNKIERFYG